MPAKRKPAPRKTANTKKLVANTKLVKPIAKPAASKPAVKKVDNSFNGVIQQVRRSLKGTHVFVLDIPWEAQMFARSMGVVRHPLLKQYLYEGLKLPQQLEVYRSEEYSLERWVEDELNGKMEPIKSAPNQMKPRKHQISAVKKIEGAAKLGWRGFILADNVGLGKSLSATFGAYFVAKLRGYTPQNKAKVLIVAPKSVLPHWRNTIKASGVNNLRIVVINYDQAKKLLDAPASAASAKRASTINQRITSNGKPTINWDIIVADESHKLKNVSQRTAAFSNIAQYSSKAPVTPFVMWCSATIGQNPLELGYLAPIVGQLTGQKGLTPELWGKWLVDNRYHVTATKSGNYYWVKPKPEHSQRERDLVLKQQTQDVERLADLLFNPNSPSIRRNPEDIAGWPSQTYTPTPTVLDTEGKRLYDEAWAEFRKYIGLHPRGRNPKGGLSATLRFRQKASLLSSIPTAEFVNDLLDNGLQVAISVEFLESLDTIRSYLEKKGWHCAEISGRNVAERENERIRFQKGEAQVVLFTTLEGISLHAGEQLGDGTRATSTNRAMVVHDIRYSALDMTQIIGRTTRDGELANAYLMFTEKTIEPKILQIVLERMRNVRNLAGDDDTTLTEIENLLDTVDF